MEGELGIVSHLIALLMIPQDRSTDYKVECWTENSGHCPKEVFNKAIRHRTQRTMEKLDGKNEKYDKSDIIIA